ncbi:hypothetical protein L0222_12985 [bacterium]|nr:hypothetical protein [bacterium]
MPVAKMSSLQFVRNAHWFIMGVIGIPYFLAILFTVLHHFKTHSRAPLVLIF